MRWTLWASWILAWRKSRWLESWTDSKTEYHMVKGMMDEFSKELLLQASQHLSQFHFACFHWIIKPSDHWNILGWDVTHGLLRIILFDWLIDWESSFPPPQPWRQGWPDAGHGHQPFRGLDIARSGEGARIGIGKKGGKSSMLFQDNWVKMADIYIYTYYVILFAFLYCLPSAISRMPRSTLGKYDLYWLFWTFCLRYKISR